MRIAIIKKLNILFLALFFISLSSNQLPKNFNTNSYSKDLYDYIGDQNYRYDKNIKIAILDTYVDIKNKNLLHSHIKQINLSDKPLLKKGHGTEVAGIIAAEGSIIGLLPGISLISIVLGNEDGWSIDKLKEGIKKAINLNVNIINVSCGTIYDDPELKVLVKEATKKNILIIAAAGNNNSKRINFPAAYPEVLSVGAVDKSNAFTANTNYGKDVKIFAPGEDILSVVSSDDPDIMIHVSGSSFATPFVTSLAVLIKSRHPNMNPQEITDQIVKNADIINMKDMKYNIINFKRSIY